MKNEKQKKETEKKPVKLKRLSEIYKILPLDFFAAASMDDEQLENHLKNIKK